MVRLIVVKSEMDDYWACWFACQALSLLAQCRMAGRAEIGGDLVGISTGADDFMDVAAALGCSTCF